MNIKELLELTVKNSSSDLHLSAGMSPIIRVDGELRKLELPILAQKDVIGIIDEIMNDHQRKEFQENLETDFSFEIKDLCRFRVNAFNQARGAAAAFRTIPFKVPSMDDIHLPAIFEKIASFSHGLVLLTGPTGSGKSTTLAAIIDYINANRYDHILTIEDPIEFVHTCNKSLINQREVQRDTCSFSSALRSSLREDPDVILVGELRDLETIRLAMTAAETGHVVFATLHTSSAAETINRIIDVFPGDEKPMIRSMLSESLQAVIAQTLLKKVNGGRIAAFEIMFCNAAIRNLIREDKVEQIYSYIQTGHAQGMLTFDQHLTELVKQNLITRERARNFAKNKSLF